MRRYMRVTWVHDSEDEPVVLFSEVINGMEARKVEVYRDGRMDLASRRAQTGTTQLSEVLMPTVDEIAQQAEFVPVEIGAAEFESVWLRASAGRSR